MIDDAVVDRVLVHAVFWPDGRIDGCSVVTVYAAGSFDIAPFCGESAGVRFTNAIAVIGPDDLTLPSCSTIPALIVAIRKMQRSAEANRCHIVTPS